MNKYNIILQVDEIAAEIYRDKDEYQFTYRQIAKNRGIKSSYVKMKYASAKAILTHQEQLWLVGLSQRAKHALLQAGFTSKGELYEIVTRGIVDLAELPSIGTKTRSEIRHWLFKDHPIA